MDPAKVTRSALQAAGSVAGLMITTQVMIADAPKEDAAGGGMPDMGGHGWNGRNGRHDVDGLFCERKNPALAGFFRYGQA